MFVGLCVPLGPTGAFGDSDYDFSLRAHGWSSRGERLAKESFPLLLAV